MPHQHAARVARQAPRRFRGNAWPVLEDGLAGLIRIREDRGVDMDDDLVALARGAGIELVVESRLREKGQRVRLLLGHRGRFRGNAHFLIQRLASRGQRPQEQRAHLRRKPPAEHHGAVLVVVDVQRPARVLSRALPRLGLAVHAPPAAYDPLDVGGRAGAPDSQ
jgi:hypothetical protein